MTAGAALKAVERHYDQLTPDERFRLAVLAAARGDETDARRLADTCPRFDYRMRDVEFSDRVRGLVKVVEYVLLMLESYRGRARREEAVLAVARVLGDLAGELCTLAYQHGWEDARGKGRGKGAPAAVELAGRWWGDTGDRWEEKFAAPAGGDWRAELAAFWGAVDGWARETTGADIGAIVTRWHGGGSGDYFAGLAVWATETAAAVDADQLDQAEFTEARAALDGLWTELVTSV